MDVLDQYLQMLADTAQHLVNQGHTSPLDATLDLASLAPSVPELIDIRAQFLGPEDRDRVRELLETGYCDEMTGDQRAAAIVVYLELNHELNKLDLYRRFQPYGPEQPLFLLSPNLLSVVLNSELIAGTHVRQVDPGGLVAVPGGWTRLDPFLSASTLSWVESAFADARRFIRLDPWFVAETRPELLEEAVVRPARPNWWSTLSLRPREQDGAHYVLQESAAARTSEYWDYHVLGVRSLEVRARRDAKGNLSMMIEELLEDRWPDSRLIGRCIHLDTDSSVGTDADAASLNHIDLAINAYFGEVAERRRAIRLSDGTMERASVRTHLLRVEDIPYSSLIEFARQFFCSKVLLREWMQDQFGVSLPSDIDQ